MNQAKKDVLNHIISEINSHKSDLIRFEKELKEAGLYRQGESLSTIIMKLECWQVRNHQI